MELHSIEFHNKFFIGT